MNYENRACKNKVDQPSQGTKLMKTLLLAIVLFFTSASALSAESSFMYVGEPAPKSAAPSPGPSKEVVDLVRRMQATTNAAIAENNRLEAEILRLQSALELAHIKLGCS